MKKHKFKLNDIVFLTNLRDVIILDKKSTVDFANKYGADSLRLATEEEKERYGVQ